MAIGTKIENVPQDVPVENAIKIAMKKMITGMNATPVVDRFSVVLKNAPMPRRSVMPFNVQANVRIKIAGIIILAPSGNASIISLKVMSFLGR